MKTTTDCQRELIRLGYLMPGEDDGRFGERTLAAFNHFLASKGKPPVTPRGFTLSDVNAALFPDEQPKPVPRSNPITDFITGLAVKAVLNQLKRNIPMLSALDGKKTYILAALIILCSAAETFLGIDIPEFKMGLGEAFAVGLALITGRAGAKADAAKIGG